MRKQEQLLKPEDVAEMLNLARKTIVTMAREGRLPAVRVGRFYRFDADEVARWIQSNRQV